MTLDLKHFPRLLLVTTLLFLFFSACDTTTVKNCGPQLSTENTVTIRMNAAVVSLNPLHTRSGYDGFVAEKILPCLSVIEPQTLELKPMLVKKVPEVYTVKNGPYAGSLAYDFEFYDEAVWDNGSPITAKDYIFTVKAILHPESPLSGMYRGYFQYLTAIEPDPSNPKKFTTYFNKFYILALATLMQIPVFPAYNYDPQNQLEGVALSVLLDPEQAKQRIATDTALVSWAAAFRSTKYQNDKNFVSGAGAYRLEQIDVAQGCVLVKKQNWWGDKLVAQNPYLGGFPQKLVYRFIQEEPPTESLIRSGKVDVVPDLTAAKFLELQNDSCLGGSYDFNLMGGTSYNRIVLNHRNPILSEQKVRQALAHTVDYNYLLNTIQKGLAQRVVSPVNPTKSYYARLIKPYEYNIAKAKELLAEAGWKDTNGDGVADKTINGVRQELELQLVYAISKTSEMSAKSIQATARNAGIKFNLLEKDISTFREMYNSGNYETAISGSLLFPGLNDFYQTHHSNSIGAGNYFNISNPTLDALIEQIRTEPDETKRNVLYLKAQQLMHDVLPEIYLFASQQRIITSKRFNYVVSPNRPGYYEQYFRLLH